MIPAQYETGISDLIQTIQDIIAVLGPSIPGCKENTCEGCQYEVAEALYLSYKVLHKYGIEHVYSDNPIYKEIAKNLGLK